jgi:hypothetical protein
MNYQASVKAMIDFKKPTKTQIKEAVKEWYSILEENIVTLPPCDYEQDYIRLRCVYYIREQMKIYFTYTWKPDGIQYYLDQIGNEIYYGIFSGTQGESKGICHLDNQTLLRICKHFLSL